MNKNKKILFISFAKSELDFPRPKMYKNDFYFRNLRDIILPTLKFFKDSVYLIFLCKKNTHRLETKKKCI